jgi:hypothetical protein
MDWKDIAGEVGKFAPLVGTLIGGPAGAAIGGLVSAALGTSNSPDAISAAIATDPNAALKLAQFQSDNAVKLQAMVFAHADKQLDADTAQIAQVNATMQTEDKTRVFSWRDYWGYVSGSGFGFVVGVICYLVIGALWQGHPEYMAQIPQIVGAFSVLFGIAAGVLGVQAGIEAHHAGVAERLSAGEIRNTTSTK